MFYDRFVYLCKQKGVPVSRGALDAGISKSLVTKWKTNGTKTPSADIIEKLCKYFNMTVSELLDEENEKAPTESGERKDVLDEVDIAFYGEYKELTEEQKATIRDMVAVMRKRRATER